MFSCICNPRRCTKSRNPVIQGWKYTLDNFTQSLEAKIKQDMSVTEVASRGLEYRGQNFVRTKYPFLTTILSRPVLEPQSSVESVFSGSYNDCGTKKMPHLRVAL
jgi:hypothetical protein